MKIETDMTVAVFGYAKGISTQMVYVCNGWAARVVAISADTTLNGTWYEVILIGTMEVSTVHSRQCEEIKVEMR